MKITINKTASLAELKRAPKQLAAGLAIMLVCSVLGGLILNTQNQTETLLVLNRDVAAGDAVSAEYFNAQEVLVSTLNTQWLTPTEINSNSFFALPLSKGDALRASDISQVSSDLRLVSFAVEETDLPASLKAGDLIDFWEVGIAVAKPLAVGLAVQQVQARDNRGVYQVGLLVSAQEVAPILKAISNESFRLVTNVN